MNSLRFWPVAGLVAVSACTSVPDFPPEYSLSVSDVVNNVRCELKSAAKTPPLFFSKDEGWLAGTNIALQVVEDATFGLKASAEIPLNPATLVVAVGGGYQGTADRLVNFDFQDDLKTPEKIAENIDCAGVGPRGGTNAKLTGDLGIAHWLSNLQATTNETQAKIYKSGYTLKFTIKKNASGNATFSAIPIGTPKLGADVSLAGSRTNTHTLTMTFTKKTPTTKKVVVKGKVIIKKIVPAISDEQRNRDELNNLLLQQSIK